MNKLNKSPPNGGLTYKHDALLRKKKQERKRYFLKTNIQEKVKSAPKVLLKRLKCT